MEWQVARYGFFSALIAIQLLTGCAAETYAIAGCPQVPPSIARHAEGVVVGSIERAGYNFQTGPFQISMYELQPIKVLKEAPKRIPDRTRIIAKSYSLGEGAGPALTDDGFIVGPPVLEVGSASIVALGTVSPGIATAPGYDHTADYEVVYGQTCSDLPRNKNALP